MMKIFIVTKRCILCDRQTWASLDLVRTEAGNKETPVNDHVLRAGSRTSESSWLQMAARPSQTARRKQRDPNHRVG